MNATRKTNPNQGASKTTMALLSQLEARVFPDRQKAKHRLTKFPLKDLIDLRSYLKERQRENNQEYNDALQKFERHRNLEPEKQNKGYGTFLRIYAFKFRKADDERTRLNWKIRDVDEIIDHYQKGEFSNVGKENRGERTKALLPKNEPPEKPMVERAKELALGLGCAAGKTVPPKKRHRIFEQLRKEYPTTTEDSVRKALYKRGFYTEEPRN